MIETCWIYQCSNPECAGLWHVNNVVLEYKYPDGIVPCPRCRKRMERIREAQPGEYDAEGQEAAAQRASTPLTFRIVETGAPIPYHSMNPVIPGAICFYSCPNSNKGRCHDSADASEAHGDEHTCLTEPDVAQLLGISVRAVRRLVKDKKLRAIRPTKKKLLFTRALIDEYLQSEAGIPSRPGDRNPSTSPPGSVPSRSSLSLEESRALLRDISHKSNDSNQSLDEIPPFTGSRRKHVTAIQKRHRKVARQVQADRTRRQAGRHQGHPGKRHQPESCPKDREGPDGSDQVQGLSISR